MNRIVRGSPAALSLAFTVDEVPTDLDAPPAVVVTRVDGTQAAAGASTRTGLGEYTYTLPAQSQLSSLTAVWSGLLSGLSVSAETYAEVVGGQFFSVAELRNFDSVLMNTTKYPTAKLVAARLLVESDFEGFCNRAFFPRGHRETIFGDGTKSLWLAKPDPLRLVSLVVDYDQDWSARMFTRPDDNLHVINLDNDVWPKNTRIDIEYEYGFPTPPVRVVQASKKLAKYRLVADQSRIDERATTMNIPDFGNFVLSTPGMRDALTGIPDVDVVLWDYALDRA